MEIKPIRTELDYQAALHTIEGLLDSLPGTPEGDRLDVLVTLVEAYEARHFPIPESVSAMPKYSPRMHR